MKIFQLNDYEWWFAETLEAAYAEAEKQTGVTEKEQREDFEAIEIPETLWDKKVISVEDDAEDEMDKMSWREVLEDAMADGSKAGFLCGTEV